MSRPASKKSTTTSRAKKPAAKRPAARKGTAKKKATDGKPGNVVGKAKRNSRTKKATASVAERAAKQAKAAGATKGGRLPSVQMQLRDRMIVSRAAQGWLNSMIAAEAKCSERTVERVLARSKELPSPLDENPLKLVRRLVTALDLDVADFEAMAFAYAQEHPSAAVGAKKAATERKVELLGILQTLGHVPDLASLRVPLEAGQMARAMVDAVEAFEDRIDALPLDDEQKAAIADATVNLRTAFAELIGDDDEEVYDAEPMPELTAGAGG